MQSTGQSLTFHIRLDGNDPLHGRGQQEMAIELIASGATVEFDAPLQEPHPDTLALAALTVFRPWCASRMRIDSGVSSAFADVVGKKMGLQIEPVDRSLRARPPGQRLGLMYSGGPDCMAAEMLLADQLPLFHFRRVKHPRIPNRVSYFRGDVQEAIARKASDRGAELHVARSDLEFTTKPFPTFPHWTALTIGAVLQAEQLDLGGIVSGRNISGIYLGWGHEFRPNGDREEEWDSVYRAAGLPMIQPLAGASDIASKEIARSHRFHNLARSCVRGSYHGPCLRCKKCFITELMSAATRGAPVDLGMMEGFASQPKLLGRFSGPPPYPNQHLLAYSLARIPNIATTFLAETKTHLSPTIQGTKWMERYYRPALSQRLPNDIAAAVGKRVSEHMEFMTLADEKTVESWKATA